MESIIYKIDYHDGTSENKTESELRGYLDDIIDDIRRLRKRYKWRKTRIVMTLYTSEEDFEATEYITYYQSLSEEKWGASFLTNFDIELIKKLNF